MKSATDSCFVDVLQHAVRENTIDALRADGQRIDIAAEKTAASVQLTGDACRGSKRINVDVHSNWAKAGARCCDRPPPPAATEINEESAFAVAERPTRNRIPRQAASHAPIQIAIGIHDPVVHKRVDPLGSGSIVSELRARWHVERHGLASRTVGEDWHTLLCPKAVILSADERALAVAKRRVIMRASQNMKKRFVEQTSPCLLLQPTQVYASGSIRESKPFREGPESVRFRHMPSRERSRCTSCPRAFC